MIKDSGGRISLSDFRIEYTPEQRRIEEELEGIYRKAGLEPPLTEDVISEFRDRKTASQILSAMGEDGTLAKLDPKYYIHGNVLKDAVARMTAKLTEDGRITLAEYRDLIGTSRKYAVMILDHTDKVGITKMTGDFRVLNR